MPKNNRSKRFSPLYEHRRQPLLSRAVFLQRMIKHGVAALFLLVVALGIGILGYHFTENLSWLDSLLNASMILSGMGPVDEIHTVGGKLFASGYALFSGVAFLVMAGMMITPIAHRLLHILHLEEEETPL